MTKRILRVLQIPFPGFYESELSQMIDYEQEQTAENDAQTDAEYYSAESRYEGYWHELIRLDDSKLCGLISDNTDYSIIHEAICKDYAESFSAWIKDETDLDPRLTFESMSSPKYYNFESDRLFCYVPVSTIRRFWTDLKKDNWTRLAAVIKRRHTSYDGFHSWYSNRLEDWLDIAKEGLSGFDHNHLQTILIAWLDLNELDLDSFRREYIESASENSYQFTDSGIDYAGYESDRIKTRIEKLGKLESGDLSRVMSSHGAKIREIAESHPADFIEALGNALDNLDELDAPGELDRITKALDPWFGQLVRSNPGLSIPALLLDALDRFELTAPCNRTLDLFQPESVQP